jgi:hypothetical protein
MDNKPTKEPLAEQEEWETRLLAASPKGYVIYQIGAAVLTGLILLIGLIIIRYLFR